MRVIFWYAGIMRKMVAAVLGGLLLFILVVRSAGAQSSVAGCRKVMANYGETELLIDDYNSDGKVNLMDCVEAPDTQGLAERYTQDLLDLKAQWEVSGPEQQAVVVEEMLQVSAARKEVLLELIPEDTAQAYGLFYTSEQLAEMPGEITDQLEQRWNGEGEMSVLATDDFEQQQTEVFYSFKVSGQDYKVYFASRSPALGTGDVVQVDGYRLANTVVVPPQLGGMDIVSQSREKVSGAKRVLAILINFSNNQRQPFTVQEVRQNVLGTSNSLVNYYQENSNGKLTLSGDVIGWYTINSSDSACNMTDWADAADSKASQAGFNPANYDYVMYIFPWVDGCSYGGSGEVCGKRTWFNNYIDTHYFTHELGHNLCNAHASAIDCGPLAIDDYANCDYAGGGNCDVISCLYGDQTDTMGLWNTFQYNAPHKYNMGWVDVDSVVAEGDYRVYALEMTNSSPRILRIHKPDTNEDYYVSYRQPIGYDAGLPVGITKGANIHIWSERSYYANTHLVDTSPLSDSAELDFKDAALETGESFYDQVNDIRITQIEQNWGDGYIVVRVEGPITSPPVQQWRLNSASNKSCDQICGDQGLACVAANTDKTTTFSDYAWGGSGRLCLADYNDSRPNYYCGKKMEVPSPAQYCTSANIRLWYTYCGCGEWW